ncbi:MAG: tRNA (adenosine(37)-N6)-threonylcarbamoyltransferase complex ATPase subunit type 1 TsaE, partial [Candidatus Pacebacteria bacterium]|nr:tRNA (adenosine(37)-N6)-threonylcarbamoyltransferase complex ATPase subunit type 1 TsaE [Candidatus Paceibacterota bacterium]
MKKTYFTDNATETKKKGEVFAKSFLKPGTNKSAVVLGLIGDLGGGKTTFLQGFAKGLGVKERITSPTFVILKSFEIKDRKFKNFYHIDCYRIQKPEESLN